MRQHLVSALDETWQGTLDEIARAHRWPTSAEPALLGARVAELSASYNKAGHARAARERGDKHGLAARLGFSFARDVPKGAAAVRELVATGLLSIPSGRPLRILDVGAGLGATSWGLVRALAAASGEGEGVVDAHWIDTDADALRLGETIATRRRGENEKGIALNVRTTVGTLANSASLAGARFDVILLGQVLSELDPSPDQGDDAAQDANRAEQHVSLLRRLLDGSLDEHGSMVIVEPALRDRTRHLHRIRDMLLPVATVFAPCLHGGSCPALREEGDWCHEDLGIDLPAWLVPVARAAGLRWQGLTFSYLVLRRDAETLAARLRLARGKESNRHLRVVSGPLVSKGKREMFLCGEFEGSPDETIAGRTKTLRLDRHRTESNVAWDTLSRGDVISVVPAVRLPENANAPAKVPAESVIDVWSPSK